MCFQTFVTLGSDLINITDCVYGIANVGVIKL